MPINGITVIDKLLLCLMGVLVFIISVSTLMTNGANSSYVQLAQNVREGRSVRSDMEQLHPYTNQKAHDGLLCNLKVRRTLAVLSIYVSDLEAQQAKVITSDEPSDFHVQIQQSRAMSRVRDVLVCAPLDGDMWFRLSLFAFILNMDEARTKLFLDWSIRTSPQEAWIKNQRDAFLLIYSDKYKNRSGLR